MDEILSATVDSRNGIVLDPRTKLFMLITITTLMFSTSNDGIMNIVKPILSLIPFALILSEHKFKTAGKYAPGIMTGAYLISSTSVSEFISAMERMHVTEKIIIPLSVIFRFFPTIKEEYQAIRDAMKMRNIRFGGKNPFLMIEYRLIPLMVSVIKIGDELSAAALTRGLGAPIRRTNVCEIGFHVQDFIAIVVCFACFILFFLHQYIVF